jgi:AcrR family transcriptional regulator
MVRTVKKPEVRKAEIIQIARHLFQTRDYDKTTMQDVMDELGIAKGTIYYYFKSKEELLEAVIENMVDERLEYMQKVVAESSGNALERLELLINAGNMANDDANSAIMEQMHRPDNSGMHTRLLATAIKKQAPIYAQLMQQGCAEGFFETETPLEAAEFILTSTQFLSDCGIYLWTDEDINRRMKALPSLIEAILRAKSGSFQFLLQQGK